MQKRKQKTTCTIMQGVLMIFISLSMLVCNNALIVNAEEASTLVAGKVFEFGKKEEYEFSKSDEYETTSEDNTYGKFVVNGNLVNASESNGVYLYGVDGGEVSFGYYYDASMLKAKESKWHLVEDKSKTVDNIKLDDKILKGALILQTSKDGKKWIDDIVMTNLFEDVPTNQDNFYKATNVQLVNGCYYRVIVAYEVSKMVDTSKFLFFTNKDYDYKKYAEVYEFYLYDNTVVNESSENTLKYNLGAKVNTGKDGNGYSGSVKIDDKDPHYGWDLGEFFVSGYTSEVEDREGNSVFLKNVGDKVTLWFNLKQDIDCLNGNEKLSISRDDDGFDQYFETKKTDFGRGTLIIRYTDHENVKHTPDIYTNYLEANISPGADTKVQLFEEGDYEVALDYEIKNDKTVVLGQSVLPEYNHYRIFFKFSVRNGNCMVYAFDEGTEAELSNGAITENGFRLDLAKSRYLDINIKKEILEDSANGLVEDVRFNKPAKDGEVYTEEGLYTFTVANPYTKQQTTKRIYVGTNNLMKAYMATGLSIEEIENKIADGATIGEDGTIIELSSSVVEEVSSEISNEQENQNDGLKEEDDGKSIAIIAGVGIVLVAVVVLLCVRKKIVRKDSKNEV